MDRKDKEVTKFARLRSRSRVTTSRDRWGSD